MIRLHCVRIGALVALAGVVAPCPSAVGAQSLAPADGPGMAVLLVDTDHPMGTIDERVYGHFLEFINHSIVDGLFAEQIRGQGFEGDDFPTYWTSFGAVEAVSEPFENGETSVRLDATDAAAGIRQDRIYLQEGLEYDGSVWLRVEEGSPEVTLRLVSSGGDPIAETALATSGFDWREAPFTLQANRTDTMARVEVVAAGGGRVLVDFLSLMRGDVRENGMLRPDLLEALDRLKAPFLRWPGGSFASTYRWSDGIGPQESRVYHPNAIWGGYADYYGFGTDEFMELARLLDTDPIIVLPAPTTDPEAVQYAMDWVHYLTDPPTTEWGRLRAENGHPEPYDVPYIQIDNEPMNQGLTPEAYAEIVNVYGSRLREIAPDAIIVASGQKRSTDMNWSQKVIDIAGENFDVLGVHNYEYEPDLFQTGVTRIEDYLIKLRDVIRTSDHPDIEIGVLEWNLSRTYDWRAGLHAAGSLIAYEKLGPEVTMAAPALLMRNTSDDPTWSAFIYHDHVSWFPGSAYVVEKLFRQHYAPTHFASTSGTFRDLPDRKIFFDEIAQMKPEDWTPGTVDAIATGTPDGRRIVIKAVNYTEESQTLLTRLQGSTAPRDANVRIYTVTAGLHDAASLEEPDKLDPKPSTAAFSQDMAFELQPYTVAVIEMTGE